MSAPILSFRAESGPGFLPVDVNQLIASRVLVQANSGGGKSTLLRYLCEQLNGRVQQIIIDPEGEFSSLRERFDYLLAGAEGDVPTHPKAAKLLARRLVELGVSAVVDVYALSMDDRRRFVRLFLDELMHLPRTLWRPLLVVIDEAHQFAPERGAGEAESTQAVITLCTQGRKRGFAAVLATQRISKLHKDAAAELLNKLIGRTGLDVDMKRAGDELGFEKERRLTLRELEPGHFYAFGPAMARGVTLVRSGAIKTTHPKPGAVQPPAPPAPAAIQKLVTQLQDLPKQADDEARTLEDAHRKVRELEKQLRQAARGAPSAIDVEAIEQRAARKIADEAAAHARAHEAAVRESVEQFNRELTRRWTRISQWIQSAADDLRADPPQLVLPGAGNGVTAPMPAITSDQIRSRPRQSRDPQVKVNRPSRPAPKPAAAPAAGELGKGERVVLTAICQHPDGVDRVQLSILTGYKRSSRDTYIQRLRAVGLVDVRGDLVVALDGAEAQLGDFEPLPTGSALADYWLDRLTGGEEAVLRVLLEDGPQTREVITTMTGYKRSSRDTYIQRLRARKLIEVDGAKVCASEMLYD